ncbi:UNVERIFIED_CONTAM: spore germination protein KC [Brevibacillus sp. OAP136]
MNRHPIVVVLMLVLLLITMTGCWGREELNNVAIIHTVAVDKEKGNQIRLTIEISDLVSQSQTQGPIGLKGKPVFLTVTGESIFEAARKLRNSSSRYLIWGHANAFIISKELAQGGIKKYFDVLMRQRHFRNTMNVFIAEQRAADLLGTRIPQQAFISTGLKGLVEAQKSTANTKKMTQIQVSQTLINRYQEVTIPAIQMFKLPISNQKSIRTVGLFAFKGDKLHSYMDAGKTKSYLRAINEASGAVETLSCEKPTGKITFENTHNHSKMSSILKGKAPQLTIELFSDFNIVDVQCGTEITTTEIEKMEQRLNEKLKQQMQEFIVYMQKNNLDLLGIGELIHREHPQAWKTMKAKWEQTFPHVQFKIVVNSHIEHTSLLSMNAN